MGLHSCRRTDMNGFDVPIHRRRERHSSFFRPADAEAIGLAVEIRVQLSSWWKTPNVELTSRASARSG